MQGLLWVTLGFRCLPDNSLRAETRKLGRGLGLATTQGLGFSMMVRCDRVCGRGMMSPRHHVPDTTRDMGKEGSSKVARLT
jgi:hypothetical protein